MKLNKKFNKGFTIIEVMIVLAIAGVIMGIVFLAIPNLQRNSRNNQIRTDANNLLSLISEYSSNNNGNAPGWVQYDQVTGLVNIGKDTVVAPSATANAGKIRSGLNGGTTSTNVTMLLTTSPTTIEKNYLYVARGTCSSNKPAYNASARTIAIGFAIETGGGTTDTCIES